MTSQYELFVTPLHRIRNKDNSDNLLFQSNLFSPSYSVKYIQYSLAIALTGYLRAMKVTIFKSDIFGYLNPLSARIIGHLIFIFIFAFR